MNKNHKLIFVNSITLLRLILAFYIVLKDTIEDIDLFVLFVALITDFFDGFFARKLDAKSKFGQEFDQMTDKVVFYLLYYKIISTMHFGHYYFLFLFIFRDTLLTALRISNYHATFVTTNFINKFKTGLQFAMIIFSFLCFHFGIDDYNLIFVFSILAVVLSYIPILKIFKHEFL
jgi:CDP-diacylglycerol--glycerol-3-phosphate 3-phosphatidyltransferase